MFLIYNNGKPSLGATQDARLATINHRLASFYEEHKGISSRLEQLTLNTLLPGGSSQYADLRGPTVKAANTRQAMPMLRELANRSSLTPTTWTM